MVSTNIILSEKKWNRGLVSSLKTLYRHSNWELIDKKKDLRVEVLEELNVKNIFIPHWSYFIPQEIYKKYECTTSILTFETFSGTERQSSVHPKSYRPNIFIEISKEELEIKKQAMDCYLYEKREYPHPRSNKALEISVKKNGIIVGCNLVGSFCLIRSISKNEIQRN